MTIENVVVLDACVLYPAPLRDFLLNLSYVGVFQPKWTAIIQQEWTRNLLSNRQDLSAESLQRTVQAMNTAFPDAQTEGFETYIPQVYLPDSNDRHVVATAIQAQAQYIITFNLKDFPKAELDKWHIKAIHPDMFVASLFPKKEFLIQQAFENQVKMLKNPPLTTEKVLENLAQNGLQKTVDLLQNIVPKK